MSELCPKYCEFRGKSDNPGIIETCKACANSEVTFIVPALIGLFCGTQVEAYAKNKTHYYIRDKNGSTGTIIKSALR